MGKTFIEYVTEKVSEDFKVDERLMGIINKGITEAIPLTLVKKLGDAEEASIQMGTFATFSMKKVNKGGVVSLPFKIEFDDSLLKSFNNSDFKFGKKEVERFKNALSDSDYRKIAFNLVAGYDADGCNLPDDEKLRGPRLVDDLLESFAAYIFLSIAELLYENKVEDETYTLDAGHGEYKISLGNSGDWKILFEASKEFKQLTKNDKFSEEQ